MKIWQILAISGFAFISPLASADGCVQHALLATNQLVADGLVAKGDVERARAVLEATFCGQSDQAAQAVREQQPAKKQDKSESSLLGVEIKQAERGSKGHERLRRKR